MLYLCLKVFVIMCNVIYLCLKVFDDLFHCGEACWAIDLAENGSLECSLSWFLKQL
jgi:hypothetical protein